MNLLQLRMTPLGKLWGCGPQNWGQSPIRGDAARLRESAGPNWDPTPNLLQR